MFHSVESVRTSAAPTVSLPDHPLVLGTAVAVPERWCSQAEILEHLAYRDDHVARKMFLENGMDGRYLSLPPEQFARTSEPGFQQQVFQASSVALAERSVRALLRSKGLAPSQVSAIVTMTTYGFVVPSISACLVQRLGLPRNVAKLNLAGSGCLGGVSLLDAASCIAAKQPGQFVVAVSSEVGSLFLRDWPAEENRGKMVINALMGDASVALLLGGRSSEDSHPRPRILDVEYASAPDTLEAVDIRTAADGTMTGHILPSVPRIAHGLYKEAARNLLQRHGLTIKDITHWAIHPGSRVVIEAVQDALELRDEDLVISREVLRRYGNVCSATALVCLHEGLQNPRVRRGEYGIVGGVGPGMTVGLNLLRWT